MARRNRNPFEQHLRQLNVFEPGTWLPKLGNPTLDAGATSLLQQGLNALAGRVPPDVVAAASTMVAAARGTGANAAAVMRNPAELQQVKDGDKTRFMRDLAKLESGVISITGRKGSGKSVLSFRLGTLYRDQGRKIFVIGVPERLIKHLGFTTLEPDQVDTIPLHSVVIVDDAGTVGMDNRSYGSDSANRLQRWLIITRHRSALLIWNNIASSQVNRFLIDSDVFFLKVRSRIGARLERNELREILEEADAALKGLSSEEQKRTVYAYSEPLNFSGLISYGLPEGWNEKLSRNKA